MNIVVAVKGDADLFQRIFALRPSGGFASLLNGWQQQGDKDRNNRNHDEQFNQCKSAARADPGV